MMQINKKSIFPTKENSIFHTIEKNGNKNQITLSPPRKKQKSLNNLINNCDSVTSINENSDQTISSNAQENYKIQEFNKETSLFRISDNNTDDVFPELSFSKPFHYFMLNWHYNS